MSDLASTLRERLLVLSPLTLEIRDEGAQHRGHAAAEAGGRHFSVLIVSEAFAGLPRLARHQRVLGHVSDLMPHPLHALSIKALSPDESAGEPLSIPQPKDPR